MPWYHWLAIAFSVVVIAFFVAATFLPVFLDMLFEPWHLEDDHDT